MRYDQSLTRSGTGGGSAFYLGISLLSAASLLLQVSFSRILSVTQGHHFAFLIVSTALLGIGLAGTYLMLHKDLRVLEPEHLVVLGPLLFGLASVGAYLALNQIPFDVVRMAWEARQLVYFILAYLILGIPFFFSGLTIASAFLLKARRGGSVYFADLTGAATGAFLPLVLFPVMGGVGIILATASLAVSGGILLWSVASQVRLWRHVVVLCTLFILALTGFYLFPEFYSLQLSPYRGLMVALRYPEAEVLTTRWNAISRVDVVRSPAARFAPGLSLNFSGNLPPQLGMSVDTDQLHAMTAYDGTKGGLAFIEHLPSAAPYFMGHPGQVYIANPGGGLDVLTALYFDADRVVVSEKNPLILSLISHTAKDFPQVMYKDPRVQVHIAHERSFLQTTRQSYDLIVISQLQALGASAGLLGFSEDYGLTREAFQEYYARLSKHGLLAMTRYLEPQPVYAVRQLATAVEALEQQGVGTPARCLAVIRSWGTLTVLIKPGGFSEGEISALRHFTESRGFDLDYYPDIRPDEVNRFNRFPEPVYYELITGLLDPDRRQEIYRNYPFQVTPVSDDRPFFFYVLKWDTLGEVYSFIREKWLFFVEAGLLVPILLVQAAVISAVLILLPTALKTRSSNAGTEWSRGGVFTYFSCIALGFMGIEMSMIQRLILYLSHPIYALSAVLAFLLLFAGLGSAATLRWHRIEGAQVRVLVLLTILILLEMLLLPWVLKNLLGVPLSIRFLVAMFLISPLGLLMGMPFPLGMERLKRAGQEAAVAWAWAINGSTSVVAAIFSVFLALNIGMTSVFVLSAAAYAIAGWTARRPWN